MVGIGSNPHGALCEPIADALRHLVSASETRRVYQDHAGEGRHRLWAHLDREPHRWNILSGVDVLLADTDSGEAILVMEIEETACSPKKLLGDAMSLSLAQFITTEVDGRRYAITPSTELWVCLPASPRGHQRERNKRLLCQLRARWGGELPLQVRLVASDGRETLKAAVCDALQEWFKRHPTAW